MGERTSPLKLQAQCYKLEMERVCNVDAMQNANCMIESLLGDSTKSYNHSMHVCLITPSQTSNMHFTYRDALKGGPQVV